METKYIIIGFVLILLAIYMLIFKGKPQIYKPKKDNIFKVSQFQFEYRNKIKEYEKPKNKYHK